MTLFQEVVYLDQVHSDEFSLFLIRAFSSALKEEASGSKVVKV